MQHHFKFAFKLNLPNNAELEMLVVPKSVGEICWFVNVLLLDFLELGSGLLI